MQTINSRCLVRFFKFEPKSVSSIWQREIASFNREVKSSNSFFDYSRKMNSTYLAAWI